jgi:hypothetical protein
MIIFLTIVAFLIMWAALFYFVIWPKLVSFRTTAGIYVDLADWERTFWSKSVLWLKGVKVAILGIITSSVPVLAIAYQQASTVEWTKFLPTEKAQLIVTGLAVIGFLAPIVMVILHQSALADASATTPVAPAPPAS